MTTGDKRRTRAIWIVGTPFSGSTLTQFAMGRFSKVFVAGEIDRIRAFNMHPHLAHDPKAYLGCCAYCKAHDLRCDVWTDDVFKSLSAMGPGPAIYDCLAECSGKEVVVDCSKTPWWFLNVAGNPDFRSWCGRVFALHCVRHPFAFAVSYAGRTGMPFEQCVNAWVVINRDAISVVQRCGGWVPMLTVNHNEMLKNPEGLLSALSSWLDLGVPLEPSPLHFLGGNVAAWPFEAKPEQSTPQFDASVDHFKVVNAVADDDGRWRSRIDQGMRWRLAGLPGVRPTCAQLGIDIDGLIAS